MPAIPGYCTAVTWADWVRGPEVEPSIYAADFSRLGAQLGALLDAGARIFHFDVGDHQVAVELRAAPVDEAGDRREHDRPDRDLADELAVTGIEMEDPHTCVE